MNDEDMFEAFRQGNQEAFAALYTRCRPRLRRFLESLGARGEDLEDVTQEAFLKAHANAARFDRAKASFRTWLFLVARHLWIDFCRRRNRAFVSLSGSAEEEPLSAAAAEHQAEVREEVHSLWECVGKLPSRYRSVMELELQTFSPAEIAMTLEVAIPTVNTWRHRARQSLRECLEACGVHGV